MLFAAFEILVALVPSVLVVEVRLELAAATFALAIVRELAQVFIPDEDDKLLAAQSVIAALREVVAAASAVAVCAVTAPELVNAVPIVDAAEAMVETVPASLYMSVPPMAPHASA